MPFTLAHPAAIVGFKKYFRKLSATGLVVGSIGPDLGYYAQFRIDGHIGHAWLMSGMVVLPYSVLFSLLFHTLVKKSLFDHLPIYFKSRWMHSYQFKFIDFLKHNFIIFILSVIIGMYSHLIWDSFTHKEGFFVELLPALNTELLHLAIYRWLQYGGSFFGMLYLIRYNHLRPISDCNNSPFDLKFWSATLSLTALIIFIRFYFFPIPIKIGNILVVPMSSIFTSLCFAGALSVLCKKRKA